MLPGIPVVESPVARRAPWAPNDQDDIGDNTQHILPDGAHPPQAHKVSLSSSSCNVYKRNKPDPSFFLVKPPE